MKSLLVMFLLTGEAMTAQFVISDFEAGPEQPGINGPGSPMAATLTRVANDNTTGLNTTTNTMEFIETTDTPTWGRAIHFQTVGSPPTARRSIDDVDGQFFTMLVRSDKPTGIASLKLVYEGGDLNIPATYTQADPGGVLGDWIELSYDFSSLNNPAFEIKNIEIAFNPDPAAQIAGTYQYDQVMQLTAPVLGIKDVHEIGVEAYFKNSTSTLVLNSKQNITSVNIYNLSGVIVSSADNFQTKSVSFGLSGLSSGLYIANITTANGANASLKFVR